MKRNNLIVILAVILIFTACKTTKNIIKTGPVLPQAITVTEMVSRLQKEQPAFTTANVSKMSVALNLKGREMNVMAACQMVSDSAIHLSIQPFFGIELFKLELTPYNIILIDKTNKKFYESGYSFFKTRFGVDINYDGIQSIISNRLFVAGNKAYLPEDFSWENNSNTSNTLVTQNENIKQKVVIDAALGRITMMILQTPENEYKMTTEYADFKKFDDHVFPENILINAENANSKSSFLLTVQRVVFDQPLTMKAANLSRYTRGDINRFFQK